LAIALDIAPANAAQTIFIVTKSPVAQVSIAAFLSE